jgi:hypothetical protein
MSIVQSKVGELVIQTPSHFEPDTIWCHLDAEVSRWTSRWVLSDERLLAAQALQLLIRLDRELRGARADWYQDRFRRVMKARSKAVARVRRRWKRLNPAPAIALGKLRRCYHANLAGYLYQPREAAIRFRKMKTKNLEAGGPRFARSRAPACSRTDALSFKSELNEIE